MNKYESVIIINPQLEAEATKKVIEKLILLKKWAKRN